MLLRIRKGATVFQEVSLKRLLLQGKHSIVFQQNVMHGTVYGTTFVSCIMKLLMGRMPR